MYCMYCQDVTPKKDDTYYKHLKTIPIQYFIEEVKPQHL